MKYLVISIERHGKDEHSVNLQVKDLDENKHERRMFMIENTEIDTKRRV